MEKQWWRCSFGNLHRSQADAGACPGCLVVHQESCKKRHSAVVAPMDAAGVDSNLRSVSMTTDGSSSPSRMTTLDSESSLTHPHAHRSVTPTPELYHINKVYPTPNTSQEQKQGRRMAPELDTSYAFIAESESPTSPAKDNGSFLQYLQPVQENHGLRRNAIAPVPDESNEIRNQPSTVHMLPPNSTSSSPIDQINRNNSTSPPTPPASGMRTSPNAALTTGTPSLPSYNNMSNLNSTSISSDTELTPNEQINHLRASRMELIARLRNSTTLIERIQAREQITHMERNQARADTQLLRKELDDVLQQQGTKWLSALNFKGVILLAGFLVLVALQWLNRTLYQPEFEWIARRTKELLGVKT